MNGPPIPPGDWVFLVLAALLTVAWVVLIVYGIAALWAVIWE